MAAEAVDTPTTDSPEVDEQQPAPRIYVASLSDYNAGRLHGTWMPAGIGAEALEAAIQLMLDASPEPGAEEWAIHDYENFGPIHLPEYISIETVARLAEGIIEHGPAFAHWAAHLGSAAWESDLDRFEDAQLGDYDSWEDFGRAEIEMHGVNPEEFGPELLRDYITFDYESFGRDVGAILTVIEDASGRLYVFDP
jgi:antirestriction protein